MGYKTVFWYGGFGGWQNLKNKVLAQSFDEFHCADEFKYTGGNSWGCPDEVLFEEVSQYVELQSDEKVFHIILTTSNHPPYTIDVENKGFNHNEVIAKLPDEIKNENIKINQLGHIWYTDKVIGDFVKHTETVYPDSLFVIIGDHSERFSFDKKQLLKAVSAIPCIFYGKEINKKLFDGVNAGVHNQLAGTIAELIGPRGFEYSAIFESMFNKKLVYNHYLSADDYEIKLLKDNQNLFDKATSAKKIAAWRVLKGNSLSYE